MPNMGHCCVGVSFDSNKTTYMQRKKFDSSLFMSNIDHEVNFVLNNRHNSHTVMDFINNATTAWKRNTRGRLERTSNIFLHDVVALVSDFLTPRDLYNTLFASKDVMASVRHNDIIRNALCNGNVNMKTTIENLYDLTMHGKIYLPSCERLTRLINAKRCELCNTNRIKQIRQGYGIAICFPCLLGNTSGNIYTSELLSEPPPERSYNIGTHEIISHPRVSTVAQGYYVCLHGERRYFTSSKSQRYPYGERRFIWDHPIVDEHGESTQIGPIVTKKDVAIFEQMRRMDDLENYITIELKAPPLTIYRDFNDAVRAYRHMSYNKSKKKQEINAIKKSNAARARQLRLTKVQRWVASLAQELPPSARYLLGYDVNRQYVTYGPNRDVSRGWDPNIYSHLHVVHFHDEEVHILFNTYISAPSRLNRRKIEAARAQIYTIYCQRLSHSEDSQSDSDNDDYDEDFMNEEDIFH